MTCSYQADSDAELSYVPLDVLVQVALEQEEERREPGASSLKRSLLASETEEIEVPCGGPEREKEEVIDVYCGPEEEEEPHLAAVLVATEVATESRPTKRRRIAVAEPLEDMVALKIVEHTGVFENLSFLTHYANGAEQWAPLQYHVYEETDEIWCSEAITSYIHAGGPGALVRRTVERYVAKKEAALAARKKSCEDKKKKKKFHVADLYHYVPIDTQ
jgi:hypothetical protein